MGSLINKLKTLFGHLISAGDSEVHKVAEAALPVVEHLRDEIEGVVKTAVDEAKADLLEAIAELKAALAASNTPPAE